jgi:hypothetical protein
MNMCKLLAGVGSIVCDKHQYKPPTAEQKRCPPSVPCRFTTHNDTVTPPALMASRYVT